jgi:hypothetical protein
MKRSQAPSEVKKRLSCEYLANPVNAASDDMTTIERMPLFGFLSIPDNLKRRFKVPTGCLISEK